MKLPYCQSAWSRLKNSVGCSLLFLMHTSAGRGFCPGETRHVRVVHLAGHCNKMKNCLANNNQPFFWENVKCRRNTQPYIDTKKRCRVDLLFIK